MSDYLKILILYSVGGQQRAMIVQSTTSGKSQPLTLPDASPIAAQRLLLPSQPQKTVTNLLRTSDGRLVNIQDVSKSTAAVKAVSKSAAPGW